jgi:hypothetical protein
MSQSCEKHAALPVVGNSPCAGCEIERLKAEVDSLTREADRQYTTIEAYRKDAERYRWLRDPDHCEDDFLDGPADNIIVGSCGGEDILWSDDLDRAIDAAMSKDPLANPGQ